MDRIEVWDHIVEAITEHFSSGEFEPGEFRVEHNNSGGTVTIVDNHTREVFQIADITGSHNTGGSNDEDPVHIVMPTGRLAEKMRRTLPRNSAR